jgi:D-glycero-D-manno-heptose 1,7-bisphosphate phosphatase
MTLKTIFLDRDGVINQEKKYLYKIEDFEFIQGVFSACLFFIKEGFKIVVITNQSGIGRGYYSKNDYLKLTKWMIKEFKSNQIDILDVFHCPHSPEFNCQCRKPKPGLLLRAKDIYNIDMKNSWLIGDKENDITAANNAGIYNTILVKSGHRIDETKTNAQYILPSIQDSPDIITKWLKT